jgi:hypothetical protein
MTEKIGRKGHKRWVLFGIAEIYNSERKEKQNRVETQQTN